ncbi:MAG: hypothetical protein ACAI34_07995 [Verrucomicrobium sp.]
MAFGIQSHHRAELRVEVGKTSLEELQKFHDEAASKGGGEVRGKKHSDGSLTLYVVKSGKKGIFESAQTRMGKRELGKTLVAEIFSRRLPSGPEGSTTVKGLIGKGNQGGHVSLGGAIQKVRTETASGISDSAKAGLKNIDNALSTPAIKDAFRASLPPQDQAKVDFLAKSKEFAKAKDFSVKVGLAKEMSELAGKMGLPARQTEILQATFEEFEFVHTPGQELDDVGKRKLAELTQKFDAAGVTAKEALNVKLQAFSTGPEFQSAVSIAYPGLAFAEDGARPETYLLPGSGEEFQKNLKTAKDGLSTVGQLLSAEPEMRGAFEGHVKAQAGGQEALNDYQAVSDLIRDAGDDNISNETLMGSLDAQFGEAPELTVLKEKIAGLSDLMGLGGPEDGLFADPAGDKAIVRSEINKFLSAQKKEATDVLDGHKATFQEKRDGIIAKQVGSKMLLEQLEGGRGPSGKGLGSWARFDGRALTGSGGATGSGQAQFGRHLYQVKGSVEHSEWKRKFKSGEMNHENYGEVIASNISRAMVSDKNHVPDVALRHDQGKSEAMVTSRYLQGGLGTLTEVYVKNVGPLPQGQGKHAKIHLDSDKPSGDGVMRLGATSSHDIRRNIALSALMGDHDVNTGNMIMLADGHVGRIDFGHAFNELICGVRGVDKHFGKTGVEHESNRILDFFNRPEVGGFKKKDREPKLWRDYTGVGPSYDMASALREVAATDAAKASAGVDQAKSQFTELVNSLKDSEDPGDKALLKDVMKSLKQMATNVGKPTSSDNPTEVLNHVFASLEGFIMEGQTQMMEVADLCELQAQIDDFARMSEPGEPIPQAIQDKFNELRQDGSTVRTRDGNGLTWMKTSSLHAPFKGDLTTYIATRRTEIPVEDLQRVGD